MHTGTSLEGGLTPPQDVPIRARLGRWIESSPVQNVIIGVILLNALTLGSKPRRP
jgi:hypothetical protein